MAITNTHSNAVKLAQDNSGLWVPEYEPFANIIDQERFPFLTLLGGEDIDPSGQFGATKKRTVPALIQSEKSSSMEPKIVTHLPIPVKFTVNGAATSLSSGSTKAVTLDATGGLKKYALLRARATGSVVIVDAITSTTVVSVYPFTGGTSGDGSDNIADNETFDLIGYAYPDGASYGDGISTTPATASNYMQFHVNEYGQGILAKEQKRYPGESNTLEIERLEALIQHNRGRENAMVFGKKSENTSVTGYGTVYSQDGLINLSTRTIDAGGSITYDEWESSVMPSVVENGGAGNLHALTGYKPLAVFNNIARDYIQTDRKDTVFGNKVKRLETGVGDLVLHGAQYMDSRDGQMIIFNPSLLKRKYLGNLNTVHMEHVEAQNALKEVHAYLTAETLIPRNEDAIVTVTGVLA